MKMDKRQFEDWCRRNEISAETGRVVRKIRHSEPLRRVKSGKKSVSGTFPSRKMGHTCQFESHRNELPFIHRLERSERVLEYYDQPYQLKLNYPGSKNQNIGVLHTPDFFVIEEDAVYFVECKTEDELIRLSAKNPNRYCRDENDEWICPPGIDSAGKLGLGYRVRSSREINWIFQQNVEFLGDYYENTKFDSGSPECIEILRIVKKKPSISLDDLVLKIEKRIPDSRDHVYNLIATGDIYFDIDRHLITEPENALLFADKEVASAYSYILRSRTPADRYFKPDQVTVKTNGEILWDGKPWRIVNPGEKEVTLIDDEGAVAQIDSLGCERLILDGKIRQLDEDTDSPSREHLDILLSASQSDLAEANYRSSLVSAYLSGGLPDDLRVSERTLYRWVARFRSAEAAFGQGYYGLIPKPNNGNGTAKIAEENKILLEKFIAGSFEFIFVSTQDWFVKSNSAAISGGRRGFVGASVGGRPCRTPAALQRFLTRA